MHWVPSLRAPYLDKGNRAATMGAPTSPVEVSMANMSRATAHVHHRSRCFHSCMYVRAQSVQTFGRKKTAVAVAYCKRGSGLIKLNGAPPHGPLPRPPPPRGPSAVLLGSSVALAERQSAGVFTGKAVADSSTCLVPRVAMALAADSVRPSTSAAAVLGCCYDGD